VFSSQKVPRDKNEDMMNLISKYSIRNKIYLENSEMCGCYYCLSIFEPKEVVGWIDNNETALCPKCNVDSVIGDSVICVNKDILEKANKYWF